MCLYTPDKKIEITFQKFKLDIYVTILVFKVCSRNEEKGSLNYTVLGYNKLSSTVLFFMQHQYKQAVTGTKLATLKFSRKELKNLLIRFQISTSCLRTIY